MYKLCKTEQSAQRQRLLEEGLLNIMITTRYDEISISDLCDEMGIPRKSFYRYFSGKDGALQALLDHTLMGFEDYALEWQRHNARSLKKDLECFYQFWVENKLLLDALRYSSLSGMIIERSLNYSLTDSVMPTRFMHEDSREMQKQITTFCICGLMSMVLIWHASGYDKTPAQMAEISSRLLNQPLFPYDHRII